MFNDVIDDYDVFDDIMTINMMIMMHDIVTLI